MGPSTRRAVATAATLAFLAAYIAVAVTIADYLPTTPWIRLAYNLLVGTAWGVPLLPLFSWAGRDREDRR